MLTFSYLYNTDIKKQVINKVSKYPLSSILKAISSIKIDEYHDYFSVEELWEWTLFDKENKHLNEGLEIHTSSGIPVGARKTSLDDTLSIQGDYLLFDFIGHAPSYSIYKMDTKEELATAILSKKGIFNMFTTIQIPIIKGKIPHLDLLRECKEKHNISPTSEERKLIDAILPLLISKNEFYKKVDQCRTCIIHYKNAGLGQQKAYNMLHYIKVIFQTVQVDHLDDTIDELLDYICGYIGNTQKWIWNKK